MIKSKRQPNKLKRLFTTAKFNHDFNHEVKRCNIPNCGLCIHLLEVTRSNLAVEKRFFVHKSMTCEVKNVVYVTKGRGCGDEYIGETGNFLRRRVTVHNQQIRDPKTRILFVSGHFVLTKRIQSIMFSRLLKCIQTAHRAK